MSLSNQSELSAHWPRMRERAFWVLSPFLLFAAYWQLLVFDPQAGIARPAEGAEGFFFEPTGQPPFQILLLVAWMLWRRRAAVFARAGAPRWAVSVDSWSGSRSGRVPTS